MEIVILVVVFAVQLVIGSGVLAGALYFTGEGLDQDVLLKCLGISLAAMVVGLVPMIGFISIFVWVAAVMSVFEKTLLEAFVIGLICWLISIVLGVVLAIIVVGLATAAGVAA